MCNSIIPADALQTVKFPAQELLPDFSTNRIRQLHPICRHFFIPSPVLLWLVFALPLILYPALPKLATYLEEKGLGHHYVVQNKNNPEYAATYFGLYVLVPPANVSLLAGIIPEQRDKLLHFYDIEVTLSVTIFHIHRNLQPFNWCMCLM